MPRSLSVAVLGPCEVRLHGRPVTVGGTKPRAVLVLLALYAERIVPGETLIEVLWGDDPPRTADKALQTHVSALRRALGEGFVLTKGSGWLLTGADTDAARFVSAAAAGREAAGAGEHATAAAAFTEVLALWRGTPELPDTPRAATERARWAEQRETVAEDHVDALLARGDAAELIAELEAAVAEAPLRERRWAQLMLALYRAGRQADSLAAYRRARALLDAELGVEPGPALREVESAILGHDPSLAAPTPPPPPVRPPEHRRTGGPRERPALPALPAHRTTFVGRQHELRRVDELLRGSSLVTVTGPGGVGKTRFAVVAAQAAARFFRAGVVFVDLVPVRPPFVIQSVAAALGIGERPGQQLADAVRQHLARGRWLLVLDNCEHLLDAVSDLLELLSPCPDLVVLATSRERLGVQGERVVALPGLDLHASGQAAGSEAVTLFLDRARAVAPDIDPDPAPAARVCARLDGVPLAIELAAARCASLGIDGVLAGLDDRMRLLMGARGAHRHRSLRTVLDWSHDLLDAEEQSLFRQVAIFAGGFDLPAATAVSGRDAATVADLLGRLADKNLLLVRRRAGEGSRWRLLEIIRVYARERLAAGDEEPHVRVRHLGWAATTAEQLEERMVAGQDWREHFDAVADDLRAGLDHASRPNPQAHRLARALGHLTYAGGYLAEARTHYREAAAHASGPASVAALRSAAGVAFAEMRSDLAFALLLDAAEAAVTTSDRVMEAITVASAVTLGARCPGSFAESPTDERLAGLLDRVRSASDGSPLVNAHLAAAEAWTGCPARARCDGPLAERALTAARQVDDPVLICGALDGVTTVALGEGRFRRAAALAGQRMLLLDRLPAHDPAAGGEIADLFHMVTETAIAAGDLPAALAAGLRARDDIAAGNCVPMLASSNMLVLPHALRGDFRDALTEATEMHDSWEGAGRPPAGWMAPAVYAAALACGLTGDDAGRRRWTERARTLTQDPAAQGFAPFVDCRIALFSGDLTATVVIADGLPPGYMGKFDAYARAIAAESAVVAGVGDAAARLDAVEPLAEENDWTAACLSRARARMTADPAGFERAIAGWERIDARFERACTLLLVEERAGEGRAALAELDCPIPVGAP